MNEIGSYVLPVSVVCGYVKRIFESEEMLHNITVLGEVSNLRIAGGYAYFNLKDNDGSLSCVCFGLYKTEIPKDGDKVFVSGSISFYPKGGKVSFIVDKIYYTGRGELLFFYQQLKEKLEQEGLFKEENKKNIPKFPSSVCVVTSKSGAAIIDIIRTIRNKNHRIDISVVDVRVQGNEAADDIVNGLSIADKLGVDVIILARGGGAHEDLLAFCEEKVVRAVYKTKTPVISAVGHETDVTLADYVADVRVATPTAAAELVAYDLEALNSYILKIQNTIYCKANKIYNDTEKRLKFAVNNLSALSCYFYERVRNRYITATTRMTNGVKENVNEKDLDVQRFIERINVSNPMKILKKGLYKVYTEGSPLTDDSEVKTGMEILIESSKLSIKAEVKSVEKRN